MMLGIYGIGTDVISKLRISEGSDMGREGEK